MMRFAKTRGQRGFTLIEAIVALVLLSILGMTLLTWHIENLHLLERTENERALAEARIQVAEAMQAVNPMQQNKGTLQFGSWYAEWEAKPLVAERMGAGQPMGVSRYQVALYKVRVKAMRPSTGLWFESSLRLAGYKRVRDIRPPF